MIAAMMTAANLGARLTGWGFVIFTVGSIAWTVVGLASGQNNLIAANCFLTAINLAGVWRWLGRQQTYEEGGKSAEAASRRSTASNLFTATGIAGMAVESADGCAIGRAVEALVTCETGSVSYVVVATVNALGLQEELRPVLRDDCTFFCNRIAINLSTGAFNGIAPLVDRAWPAIVGQRIGGPL